MDDKCVKNEDLCAVIRHTRRVWLVYWISYTAGMGLVFLLGLFLLGGAFMDSGLPDLEKLGG